MTLNSRDDREEENFHTLFIHKEDARRRFNQTSFSFRIYEFEKNATHERVSKLIDQYTNQSDHYNDQSESVKLRCYCIVSDVIASFQILLHRFIH
jgi:hypothetical protein